MTSCRISKVTDKATGRSVHLLRPIGAHAEAVRAAQSLEKALVMARAGHFRAVGIAAVSPDGRTWTSLSENNCRALLLAAVTDLQYDLAAEGSR